MANVQTMFTRITSVAAGGGIETRLLSPGALNTDFKGTLNKLGMVMGDVIRIFAWGRWNNISGQAVTAQVRLYYNNAIPANLAGPISDTGNNVQLVTTTSDREWWYFAQITIREGKENGILYCDSFIENVENPGTFNKMAGAFSFPTNQNQLNLSFELTALVTRATFTLDQCTIEFLPSP